VRRRPAKQLKHVSPRQPPTARATREPPSSLFSFSLAPLYFGYLVGGVFLVFFVLYSLYVLYVSLTATRSSPAGSSRS